MNPLKCCLWLARDAVERSVVIICSCVNCDYVLFTRTVTACYLRLDMKEMQMLSSAICNSSGSCPSWDERFSHRESWSVMDDFDMKET